MDPSTMDLPTTIEQTFNPAQVFNHDPTPPLPQPQPQPPPPNPDFSSTHPDYAELITAAITALKEKEGSSRIAIAKYIDRVCTNLPPNHSALLTHHLKRLKNSGYLAMVKHSYILAAPGSAPPPAMAADSNGTDVSKRKPGRPPKLKPEAHPAQVQFQDQFQAQFQAQLQAQQQQAQFHPQFQTQPQFIQQQPQYVTQPQFQFQPDPLLQNQLHFQPQQQPQGYGAPEAQNYSNLGAESVFVSLGLADGPVGVQNQAASVPPPAPADPSPAPAPEASSIKRRPGRPRKDGSTVVKPVVPKSPVQSGTKRRPGRPPKAGTVDASPGSAVSPKPRGRPRKSSTPGRRGRPKKNVTSAANVDANIPAGDPNATNIPADGGPIQTPKRRGRPPRSSNQGGAATAAVGVTDVPIAAAFDDSEAFPNTVGGVTNGAMPLGKRRGRPPKTYSSAAVAPTVKRPRKLSGRPLGRPKKNVTSPAVSDPKLVMAYEELKGKLDHMQSRIREATQALRPCLNAETPATALAAFQELEELAGPAAAGVDPMQQN